jgi:hypothetical protein
VSPTLVGLAVGEIDGTSVVGDLCIS